MDILSDPGRLRRSVMSARCAGRSIGLVPTMGYFHSGHIRLIAEARQQMDLVVVSTFVNPTQFGQSEDFGSYPRNVERDYQLAAESDVDIVFAPDATTMYPGGVQAQELWLETETLAAHLEGASRPGHFRGVATVVAKLFNLVTPDRAFFGQKDAQQTIIIARMIRDLAYPIELVVVPTEREADGLALSSRNVNLSPEQRSQAPALWSALETARSLFGRGERRAAIIEGAMADVLRREAPLGRVDYVAVSDLSTLEPIREAVQSEALISLAVHFGKTRLIDNIVVRVHEGGTESS